MYFDYDYSNNTFIAKCDEPLIINNNHLGYQVIYKLEDFEVKFATKSLSSSQMFRSFYSGFSRFIDIDKNQKKLKEDKKLTKIQRYSFSDGYLKVIGLIKAIVYLMVLG